MNVLITLKGKLKTAETEQEVMEKVLTIAKYNILQHERNCFNQHQGLPNNIKN